MPKPSPPPAASPSIRFRTLVVLATTSAVLLWLAFAVGGNVYVRDGASGKVRTLTSKKALRATTLVWGSEDVNLLAAAAGNGQLRVWEADSGQERPVPPSLRSRVLALIVYQATSSDPVVLSAAVFAMALLGLVATWIPAQRALSIDPLKLLREE